MANVTNQMA